MKFLILEWYICHFATDDDDEEEEESRVSSVENTSSCLL